MNEKLYNQLKKTCRSRDTAITESSFLKNDLGLDSVDLMNLAIFVHIEFGIDLGEKFDQGHRFETVGDITKCLQ